MASSNSFNLGGRQAMRFKKTIEPDFIKKNLLKIPPSFVSKYGSSLSSRITIRISNGDFWIMDLVAVDGHIFMKGPWDEVVQRYDIRRDYVICFRSFNAYDFDAVIFTASNCEIEYPQPFSPYTGSQNEAIVVTRADELNSYDCDNPQFNARNRASCFISFNGGNDLRVGSTERALAVVDNMHFMRPVCAIELKSSYVQDHNPYLKIPFPFGKRFMKLNYGQSMLVDWEGNRWAGPFSKSQDKIILRSWWGGFVKKHGLAVDDICVLEYVASNVCASDVVLKIHIVKNQEAATLLDEQSAS